MSRATNLELLRRAPIRPPSTAYAHCMPRPLRPQEPNAIYHVTARGNRGAAIFLDGSYPPVFLSLLERMIPRKRWICHAWCLMTTHYHLLLTTREANLASGMQWLNSMYASWLNDRLDETGHVFQGRYRSKLVETESHLLRTYRYIARNPVRAGICRHPRDWPWSSYTHLVERRKAPGVSLRGLAEHFGPGASPVNELVGLVEADWD
jgi:putative transposase